MWNPSSAVSAKYSEVLPLTVSVPLDGKESKSYEGIGDRYRLLRHGEPFDYRS